MKSEKISKSVITVQSVMQPVDGGAVAQSNKNPLSTGSFGQACLKCGHRCSDGYIPHTWKKECVNCGCARDNHRTQHDNLPNFNDLELQDANISQGDKKKLDHTYAWYPTGIEFEVVEKYMASLPKNCIPLKGSRAEQERLEKIIYQHPRHDSSIECCNCMPDIEKKRMTKFIERRTKKFFGIGKVLVLTENEDKLCHGCSKSILQGYACVIAEKRIGSERTWHPHCFRCSTCVELLVDLAYFYSPENDNIYCGRHHGETMLRRCSGCDELILSGTYTEAKGKNWHKNHFTCGLCDVQLHGKKFREENEILYCEKCFEKFAAVKCEKCKESIGIGSKKVTVNNSSWHAECFICKRCRTNLLGSNYYLEDGKLLCSECKSSEAFVQCHGCKLAISSTIRCLRHRNRCWHSECFKCIACNSWLANGEFHEMDDNLMCKTCYINKVSKKCNVCQAAITNKGVQFGLKIYHQTCFACTSCNKKLSSEDKVKEKDGKPLCRECFDRRAMKCFRCRNPITTRYTLYKDQPFHLECFKCNLCGSRIENAEFFETISKEILCEKCVRIN